MEFDEIVIGSGLVALGAVLGMAPRTRVLVVGGPQIGRSIFYGAAGRFPAAHLGLGGLGNYWHGVIPTGAVVDCDNSADDFARLFRHFYPRTDVAARFGAPWLFVPWRPIRPQSQWQRVQAVRGDAMRLLAATVDRFDMQNSTVQVRTDQGIYRGKRLWICAGALHTPALLDRSLPMRVSRPTASDHVICYLGQIDRRRHGDIAPPRRIRTRDGVWFEAAYNRAQTALLTCKPARFAFRTLDHGIEQREAFGLPTGGAVAKIVRAASPGLICEALYNRTGLFGASNVQSVYAQVVVADAHELRGAAAELPVRAEVIRAATDLVRTQLSWPQLTPSRRPDLFMPGIHLHHTVDVARLARLGINAAAGAIHVLDASVHSSIGPEHHSFKLMVAAARRTRSAT